MLYCIIRAFFCFFCICRPGGGHKANGARHPMRMPDPVERIMGCYGQFFNAPNWVVNWSVNG